MVFLDASGGRSYIAMATGSYDVTIIVMLSASSRRCESVVRLATSVYEMRDLYNPCYCRVIRELVDSRL
jgi:hypothetical protein